MLSFRRKRLETANCWPESWRWRRRRKNEKRRNPRERRGRRAWKKNDCVGKRKSGSEMNNC